MNFSTPESQWWVPVKDKALGELRAFQQGRKSVPELADSLIEMSDVFRENEAELSRVSPPLPRSPDQWIRAFDTLSGDVEVISSIALDEGWVELPDGEASRVTDLVQALVNLVNELPSGEGHA
ncbi:hypothetical protein [Streptomyces cucumeris]|uniref:hypothetical protein n=1 Tax=Streptomyces cucumeris TaxID=2962890 RepID=UPI0020C8898E|nr:hypothetical protein [Streptomyces sp. NEAU-Y11]MCP9213532.1 hypothetical protein [Streptomyces sp. NEAU-Y11]